MKLSTLAITAVLTFSTVTAAQAKPIRIYKSWGNVLQHKVRHHRNNHHPHQHRQRRVNHYRSHQRQLRHHNYRQHHQARPHRPTHHSAYPYYQRPVRY
ncbi:MAG: hypothetical protein AAFO95_18255 [Cyanobacteria bacterium J06600_6]